MAQSVLAETQSAVLPLVPYLDTLRRVFIGNAVTIYARLDDWKRRQMIGSILGGIAASPWMQTALRCGAIALTIVVFLLLIRSSGERVGWIAERLLTSEKSIEIQRRMLGAAARRPCSRDELVDRFRDGGFCNTERGSMPAARGL